MSPGVKCTDRSAVRALSPQATNLGIVFTNKFFFFF